MEHIPDIVYIVAVVMNEDRDVVLCGFMLFCAYLCFCRLSMLMEPQASQPQNWWNASPPVYY